MARDIKDELQGAAPGTVPQDQPPVADEGQAGSVQLQLDARQQRIAVRIVEEDFRAAESARGDQKYGFDAKLGRMATYDSFMKQLTDLYFGYREFKDIPWRFCSNRSLMIAMAIVETLHARMFPGVYNEDLVNWVPTKVESEERAETVSKFMAWWIRVHSRQRDFFDRWVRHCIAFGRVSTVTTWEVTLKDRGEKTGQTSIVGEDGNPVNGPDGSPMSIPPQRVLDRIEKSRSDLIDDKDIYLPKGASSIQKDPVVIVLHYFYRDLEEMEREGKAVNITYSTDPSITPLKSLLPTPSIGEGGKDVVEDEELKNIRRRNIPVDVHMEWTGIDLDADSHPEQVVVMTVPKYRLYIGGVEVSDLSYRGDRHLDLTMFLPRIDEPSGMRGLGALEMVKELALEIDAIFNQMTDGNTMMVLRPGFYDPGGDLSAPSLTLAPNKWHPVSNPQQSIYVPEFNVPTEKLILAIRLVGEFIEKLTGASAYVMGRESDIVGGSGTATRTAAIVGAANERHAVPVERMREGAARILTHHLDLVQMNLPPGMEERVLGPDHEPVFEEGMLTKESIAGDFDAYLLPDDSMGSKEAKRQLATNRYQALMQNPIVISDPAKIYRASAELLKSFGDDPEKFLGQQPEILDSYSPQVENTMILAGNVQHVRAQMTQNPIQHIMEHMKLERDPIMAALPPQAQQEALQYGQAHIQEHIQMFAMLAQSMNKGKPPQGGQPNGQGRAPRGGAGGTPETEAQPGMGSAQNPVTAAASAQRDGEGGFAA